MLKYSLSRGRSYESDKNIRSIRWMLVLCDLIIYLGAALLILFIYPGSENLSGFGQTEQLVLCAVFPILSRFIFKIYRQIWRYGGIQSYILLLLSDGIAFLFYYPVQSLLQIEHLSFTRSLSLFCLNLLGALAIRMIYRYAYKCGNNSTRVGKILRKMVLLATASKDQAENHLETQTIKVAIIGAGRVGILLAEELLANNATSYKPRCFVDVNKEKVGRVIHGLPVYAEDESTMDNLRKNDVQEVIFALPQMDSEQKTALYKHYKSNGYKVKIYDFPIMESAGRRTIREFDIEDLLFRDPIDVNLDKTASFYAGKVILITGGGGSIGSELCRQLAKMNPKQLVILDIFENGAYDIQQELIYQYAGQFTVSVEIASICDKTALRRIYEEYHPQIVFMAAAHKHVPLMEKNCIEAVKNNVFGTLNTVEISEEFGVEKVLMVSTDKAVNPTNVMGATKRMCEMIVQAHSTKSEKTIFSATRFGNVLGSAGSVIPLFKKQIARGGPITITDKRIIRYFMTIPEAAALLTIGGAQAANGELYVLDMGMPVKILELAENMIHLSGISGIEIVETGLRPGEKLYEELLVKDEELDTTENNLIFVERDTPPSMEEIEEKLAVLQRAIDAGTDEGVREALRKVVPTFHTPEEINEAEKPAE